jgi:hypothetical protein
VAVTGSTFRSRLKSAWLIAKENEMIQSFEAEAAEESGLPQSRNAQEVSAKAASL